MFVREGLEGIQRLRIFWAQGEWTGGVSPDFEERFMRSEMVRFE